MNIFDALVLTLIAACVVVWPTQLISDGLNRWLRLTTIGSITAQLVLDGFRLPLLPAYLIGVMFAGLLLLDLRVRTEPSAVRESTEGSSKKAARWALIAGASLGLLLSIALSLAYPRGA